LKISYSFRKLVTLSVMHVVIKNFCKGDKPLSGYDISHALDVPIRLVREVLFDLSEVGFIHEIKNDIHATAYYQPAKDIDLFTIQYVVDTLENSGDNNVPLEKTQGVNGIIAKLDGFSAAVRAAGGTALLKDI